MWRWRAKYQQALILRHGVKKFQDSVDHLDLKVDTLNHRVDLSFFAHAFLLSLKPAGGSHKTIQEQPKLLRDTKNSQRNQRTAVLY